MGKFYSAHKKDKAYFKNTKVSKRNYFITCRAAVILQNCNCWTVWEI